MERMQFRSTSLMALQAELHRAELLADARGQRTGVQRPSRASRTFLGFPVPWGRRRS